MSRTARLRTLAVVLALIPAHCGAPRPLIPPRADESGYVAADDGVELYYRAIGRGEPIVVVHGGPGLDHTYLLPGMKGLAERHRVIFYDQRGVGQSEAALDATTMSFDRFVSDIGDVRDAMGIDRVNLLAHSWGALPAIVYAARHPEHVKSLILMNPVEPGSRYREQTIQRQRRQRTPADSAAMAALVASAGFLTRDRMTMNAIYRNSFRSTFADTAKAKELLIDLDERTARDGGTVAALVMGGLGSFDFWDELPKLRAPTLILWGDHDPLPEAVVQDMRDRIEGARLQVLRNTGHFPYIEAPDLLFQTIAEFLSRVR
jgi:proline iminopeptidase